MPHSINHGDACFAYFNKIWGTPIRPNERRESAFRAAVKAVSAATVAPRASPRAFSAALSRSSASLSLRGLVSAMRHPSAPFGPIPRPVLAIQEDRELEFS